MDERSVIGMCVCVCVCLKSTWGAVRYALYLSSLPLFRIVVKILDSRTVISAIQSKMICVRDLPYIDKIHFTRLMVFTF